MTINDLKVDVITMISALNDIQVLQSIKERLKAVDTETNNSNTLAFEEGIANVRSGVSKDDIFDEQGNKHITFEKISKLTTDLEWEVSLEEMLESLN